MRLAFVVLVGTWTIGCAPDRESIRVTLLTRDDCVTAPTMRANLDAALVSLRLPTDYMLLDADRLPDVHPWRGYPTPTLLYRGRDVFGMPEPPSPPPPAS
jgi:hypothetical protein